LQDLTASVFSIDGSFSSTEPLFLKKYVNNHMNNYDEDGNPLPSFEKQPSYLTHDVIGKTLKHFYRGETNSEQVSIP
jgi:hypothetical protein